MDNLNNTDSQFYDMINQEDWSEEVYEDMNNIDTFLIGDVPVGNILLPTPFPGLYLNFIIGFNIQPPMGDEDYA